MGNPMFIVNTEAAIYKDGRYLIIRRSADEDHAAGGISLVGGKVELERDFMDTLEQTIIREVKEEVGLDITGRPRYVQSASFVTDTGHPVVNILFLCEEFEGEPFPASPDEVDAVYWMTPDEIYENPEAEHYFIDSVRKAEALRKELIVS